MNNLVYSLLALLVFYIVLVGEFLLPTGGLLGVIAVTALTASLVFAFKFSTAAGISVSVFIAISSPFFIMFLIRIWPNTPVGKRMLNLKRGQTTEPPLKTTSSGTPLDQLAGQRGVAKTNLLPSGLVTINGEKIDAVSTGMPIDAGSQIMVVKIDTGHVQVRELSKDELEARDTTEPSSPKLLEDSLDSFDFE
ncbi:MAG: NfeD family protein [Rubripirellula sp.]